ncbi:hypothetical protein C6383_28240, partial [Pseudomonas syringae pv. actinidiae]
MDTIAWEVKTLRPGVSDIFISSERQLDSSVREVVLGFVRKVGWGRIAAMIGWRP